MAPASTRFPDPHQGSGKLIRNDKSIKYLKRTIPGMAAISTSRKPRARPIDKPRIGSKRWLLKGPNVRQKAAEQELRSVMERWVSAKENAEERRKLDQHVRRMDSALSTKTTGPAALAAARESKLAHADLNWAGYIHGEAQKAASDRRKLVVSKVGKAIRRVARFQQMRKRGRVILSAAQRGSAVRAALILEYGPEEGESLWKEYTGLSNTKK